ncbi:cytochrome P450 [Aspergillus unguis]
MALVEDILAGPQALLVLISVVAGYIVFCLISNAFDPLRGIPGPATGRFTVFWYFRQIYSGNFHHANIALHQKHGDIVRIAPNMYSIDSPDAAKQIYGHGAQFLKTDWYSAWSVPAIDRLNLFALRDAKAHAAAKRQFAGYYSMSSMVHYEEYVDECVGQFCQRLEAASKKKERMDMGVWLQYYAFDVITNITFGKPFGFMDKGVDINRMMEKLDLLNFYSALAGLFPSLHLMIIRLGNSPAQGLSDYIASLVSERKASKKPEKKENQTEDFLDKYLTAHRQDSDKFTTMHVILGCNQNIFAGSDTTAIALSSILFHLSNNPACIATLRKEIDAAANEQRISNPITFAQSQGLPYLQAVIKESLRINPAVGLPLLRVVPAGGAVICDRFFPEGTAVGINPWVAHHNTSVFGNDAHLFRPERWLDGGKDPHAMDRYFMPFGLGSRTCIGKNISLLEIAKLVPQLVRRFDFEVDTQQEMLQGENHWFVKPKGFEAVPRELAVHVEL